MLGWMITVYRQADGGGRAASRRSRQGVQVARWQGGLQACQWLLDLVPTGAAVDLGGNGYPSTLTAKAGAVLPVVRLGPPHENETWRADPHDILGPGWVGHTIVDEDEAARCHDDEWLIVEIWDES